MKSDVHLILFFSVDRRISSSKEVKCSHFFAIFPKLSRSNIIRYINQSLTIKTQHRV